MDWELIYCKSHLFSVFLTIKEILWLVKKLVGCTIAVITALAQGQHTLLSPGPAPDSKCSEIVEVGFKSCQHKIATGQFQEKKTKERTAI